MKYYISGGDWFGENLENKEDCGPDDVERQNKQTNDPRKAIKIWFMLSKKFPTCVDIITKTRADCITLLKEATPEYLTELYQQYKNPYKLEFLINASADKLADGCSGLIEGEYGDVIYPFCGG